MKNNSVLRCLLKSDYKQGIINRWIWFVVAVPIVLYLAFYLQISFDNTDLWENTKLTVADIVADMYGGAGIFDKEEGIDFPILYISYIMIPFIITSYYPFNDFGERGKVIFTRTGKRSTWWYSKCLWNVMCILIYQISIYLTAFVYCAICGDVSLTMSENMMIKLGAIQNEISLFMSVMYIFVVPTFVNIALSLFQMMISMITSPIYGMSVQLGLMVMAIFIYTPFLPHNFLMLKRCSIVMEGGFGYPLVMMICLVVSIISVIVGKFVVEKKDII